MSQTSFDFQSTSQPSRLITIKEVEELTCLTRDRILKLMLEEGFPGPVVVSRRRLVWCPSQVREWIETRRKNDNSGNARAENE
jgi:predicted DNA-binding transcriptional regulator AlpA